MNKAVAWTCAALALQVAAVGWLVWRYERIVLNGTEVRIKCQAYDPYDPLRGRYLRMTVREELRIFCSTSRKNIFGVEWLKRHLGSS